MDELKRQTQLLDVDVKQLTREVRRFHRDKRWLIGGLVLVAVLVVLFAVVAVRAEAASREANRIAQAQEQLRAEVLCPLYGIFLGAYNPDSRAPGPDRDKYIDAYGKIRRGWSVMECTDPIVPPSTDG